MWNGESEWISNQHETKHLFKFYSSRQYTILSACLEVLSWTAEFNIYGHPPVITKIIFDIFQIHPQPHTLFHSNSTCSQHGLMRTYDKKKNEKLRFYWVLYAETEFVCDKAVDIFFHGLMAWFLIIELRRSKR
jgi:hypothetical protein